MKNELTFTVKKVKKLGHNLQLNRLKSIHTKKKKYTQTLKSSWFNNKKNIYKCSRPSTLHYIPYFVVYVRFIINKIQFFSKKIAFLINIEFSLYTKYL